MAKTLQFRRGTTAELASVTGAEAELFVDTTKDTVVVMDGTTSGGTPLATESYVNSRGFLVSSDLSSYATQTDVSTAISNLIDAAPTTLDTLNELAAALGDDANFASTVATSLSNKQETLISGTNIKTINGQSVLGSGNIDISGSTGSADFSQVAEDILPMFSEVYDIGSTDKRWYDVYIANNLDINGSQLTASDNVLSTTSDFVAGALLADDILISDNMITPDDTTAREYLGNKGVVVINGNIDSQGDWIKVPVVQTIPEVIGLSPGDITSSFTPNITFKDNSPKDIWFTQLTVDNKIIVGGKFDKGIALFNLDGTPDITFNAGSGFAVNDPNYSVAVYSCIVQPDGKFIIGGYFDSYNGTPARRIIRLNSDGTVDNTFTIGSGFSHQSGATFASINQLMLDNNGKIIVSGIFTSYNGTSSFNIIRLNSDGTVDNTFVTGSGFGTSLNPSVTSFDIQPDGKLVLVGMFGSYNGTSSFNIIRLNSDGTVDNTFVTGNGIDYTNGTEELKHVKVLNTGEIYVVGRFNRYNSIPVPNIIRLKQNGELDTSFVYTLETQSLNTIERVYIDSDNKIVAVIPAYDQTEDRTTSKLRRLNFDGTVDDTFDGPKVNSISLLPGNYETLGTANIRFIINLPNSNLLIGGRVGVLDGRGEGTVEGMRINSIFEISTIVTSSTEASTILTTGEAGLIRFNKDKGVFEGHNGIEWVSLNTQ